MSQPERDKFALPEDFELYTECTSCKTWVEAHGWCDAGFWNRGEFVNPLKPPGLPDRWMPLQHGDRQHTLAELRREIATGHVLDACKLFPLARHRNRDIVLVRAVGASIRAPLWLVHLTWREGSDPDRPRTQAFDNLAAFVAAQDNSVL